MSSKKCQKKSMLHTKQVEGRDDATSRTCQPPDRHRPGRGVAAEQPLRRRPAEGHRAVDGQVLLVQPRRRQPPLRLRHRRRHVRRPRRLVGPGPWPTAQLADPPLPSTSRHLAILLGVVGILSGCCQDLLGFVGFRWVLSEFVRICRVLSGFVEICQVFVIFRFLLGFFLSPEVLAAPEALSPPHPGIKKNTPACKRWAKRQQMTRLKHTIHRIYYTVGGCKVGCNHQVSKKNRFQKETASLQFHCSTVPLFSVC